MELSLLIVILVISNVVLFFSLRKNSTLLAQTILRTKHMKMKFEEIDTLVFDRMHATDENGISMGLYNEKEVEEVWDSFNKKARDFRSIYRNEMPAYSQKEIRKIKERF